MPEEPKVDDRPMGSCVACGDPTRSRWCSESCRRAEDGPSAEEADLMAWYDEKRDDYGD